MIRLLTLLLFSAIALQAAPKLKIHHVHQKVNKAGRPYGSPGGIYFSYTNLDPLIMYSLQYSHDMKTWVHLYNFGTFGDNTTSPLFDWSQLPPDKCFFRIVKLW